MGKVFVCMRTPSPNRQNSLKFKKQQQVSISADRPGSNAENHQEVCSRTGFLELVHDKLHLSSSNIASNLCTVYWCCEELREVVTNGSRTEQSTFCFVLIKFGDVSTAFTKQATLFWSITAFGIKGNEVVELSFNGTMPLRLKYWFLHLLNYKWGKKMLPLAKKVENRRPKPSDSKQITS